MKINKSLRCHHLDKTRPKISWNQALSIGDDLNWSKTNPGIGSTWFNPSEWWPFNPDDVVQASRWFLLLSGVLKGSLNGFNWRLIRLTCPKRRISQDWKSKGIVTTCYDGKDCEQKGVVWRCLHEFSFEAKTKYCMYKNNCKSVNTARMWEAVSRWFKVTLSSPS